jgi:two-component system, response regulator PdtaR
MAGNAITLDSLAGGANLQQFPVPESECLHPIQIYAMIGPQAKKPLSVNLSAPQDAFAARNEPLRVLIVEDEAIIAMDLEMMLEDLGVDVVGVAITAAEAVRLAEIHRPDCATMDINIKGDRDGISAAMELHEAFGIRSIFVSAYGNHETRTRAKSAHPFGWVQKPIEMRILKEMLDRVSDETT